MTTMNLESLPSYAEATSKDYWKIISPYIRSRDLSSAAVVCRRWHELLGPRLWGNPASHFGTENDAVYIALTRFRKSLPFARLFVRQWTHTLHMPPAHAETYEGPHSDWLRDMLSRLPRLQFLFVDRLPFFDHGSLLAFRYSKYDRDVEIASFSLRYLSAEACVYATSTGLSEAVDRFRSLWFLNLSKLPAARCHRVLFNLSKLQTLQVLKLSHVGLEDRDLGVIVCSITSRVRYLDFRHNRLTDISARLLSKHCFHPTPPHTDETTTDHDPSASYLCGSSTGRSLQDFEDEGFEGQFQRRLITGSLDQLPVECATALGVTHLYISDNFFTVEGISKLIQSSCLSVLDAGNITGPPSNRKSTRNNGSTAAGGKNNTSDNGAEKLIPLFNEHVSSKMRYLRIHHSLVTSNLSLKSSPPTSEEIQAGNRQSRVDSQVPPETLYRSYCAPVNHGNPPTFGLLPIMISNLRCLVLTGIPEKSTTSNIHTRIINFITNCGVELHFAREEAKASYACPPSQTREVYERNYAKSIFALERIVLEMQDQAVLNPPKPPASWRIEPSNSSTEDPDSEAYWAIAQQDFSFFDEEECGHLNMGARTTVQEQQATGMNDLDSHLPLFDVVFEISKFRRERRVMFDSITSKSPHVTFVEGHWDGEIQVVRPGMSGRP